MNNALRIFTLLMLTVGLVACGSKNAEKTTLEGSKSFSSGAVSGEFVSVQGTLKDADIVAGLSSAAKIMDEVLAQNPVAGEIELIFMFDADGGVYDISDVNRKLEGDSTVIANFYNGFKSKTQEEQAWKFGKSEGEGGMVQAKFKLAGKPAPASAKGDSAKKEEKKDDKKTSFHFDRKPGDNRENV